MLRHWKARALACKPPCAGGQSVRVVGLQGFTDSDKFDPDRFSPERKEDVKFAKNYLVFGPRSTLLRWQGVCSQSAHVLPSHPCNEVSFHSPANTPDRHLLHTPPLPLPYIPGWSILLVAETMLVSSVPTEVSSDAELSLQDHKGL